MWLLGCKVARSPERVHKHTSEQFTRLEREKDRERDSLLEAIGHMAAKTTWPMERTGKSIVQVNVMSQRATNKRALFVPPGLR